MPEYLEITTQIGCRVNCIKYCPQELIVKNYFGNRILLLDRFIELMYTVPTNIPILFAGVSEPFQNQNCIDMIEWVHNRGNPVSVSSTLVGLTYDDCIRLCDIPLERFVLHLPDACGNANIPITDEYAKCLCKIMTSIQNLEFMSMNGTFVTNRVEHMARGTAPRRHSSRVLCDMLETPGYQLMPNGAVFFCCMMRGLTGGVGSLDDQSYPDLISKHKAISYQLQTNRDSICHRCVMSNNYYWQHINRHIIAMKKRMSI